MTSRLLWLSRTTTSLSISMVIVRLLYLPHPSKGAVYCDQFICLSLCLCVCIFLCASVCPVDRSSQSLLCRSPVAVARSSSGGVAIRYVLPVLWTTSRLAVMGATPKRGGCTVQRLPWAVWRYQGGVWCLWMLCCFIWPAIGHSGAQDWAPECPYVKNYKWWVRPVWRWTLWTAAIWNSWHWRG